MRVRGPNSEARRASGATVRPLGQQRPAFYAFDPRRSAILLLGGDKTGDDRWYDTWVPIADRLYDAHLDALRREGLIDG